VGRHSAPRSWPAPVAPTAFAPVPAKTVRTKHARPIWRRSPVIPAAIIVLAVWCSDDAYKLVNHPSTPAEKSASDVQEDLSALATGPQSSTLTDGLDRVSRSSRTATADTNAKSPQAAALPARPALPRVDPDKTVLGDWVRPSAGGMSSCFCMRWGVMHEGIDLAGPLGSPIVAAGDGVVIEAGPSAGFGHWILIQHSNGDVSLYGHMYSVLVTVGEHVTAGQHIANIGSDGQSTGPHLHFGVMRGGNRSAYIDPVPWLKARGVDVGAYNPNA
jgi:murein DD-endopeptidase MepM/ murein hydrolase activator NlpD